MADDDRNDHQQTFGEAISSLMCDVEAFERFVERDRAANPERWPETMAEGEWFEQFMMFMSNGSHDGARPHQNTKFDYRIRQIPFDKNEAALSIVDDEMHGKGWERRYSDVMFEGVFAVYRRAKKGRK